MPSSCRIQIIWKVRRGEERGERERREERREKRKGGERDEKGDTIMGLFVETKDKSLA